MILRTIATACLFALPAVAALAQDADITGDAAKGEKVFRKCMACHAVGADAANKVGPELNGIIGREAAAVAEFEYSDALVAKAGEGLVWTPENLAAFLEKPRDYVKGTKMSFAGLRKEDERADVIAYLAQFDAEGGQGS